MPIYNVVLYLSPQHTNRIEYIYRESNGPQGVTYRGQALSSYYMDVISTSFFAKVYYKMKPSIL